MTGLARVGAALALQVVAQQLLGPWGAGVAGVATGVISREGRAGRLGAYSAAEAAGLLLLVAIARGDTIPQFAQQLAGNFNVPAAALYAATLLLPALQGGLLAAGVSRLLRARTPAAA
jgi:hypothetical protein